MIVDARDEVIGVGVVEQQVNHRLDSKTSAGVDARKQNKKKDAFGRKGLVRVR